jgi:UPF0755 protein
MRLLRMIFTRYWRTSLVILVLVLGAAFWVYQQARSWMVTPIAQLSDPLVYEVPRGAALITVLNDLQKRSIIKHPRELSLWLRYQRPNFKLKAGEYELRPGMTPADVVDLFDSGKVILHKVTIVEGITIKEMRKFLADEAALLHSDPKKSTQVLLKPFSGKYPSAEGWFFPDTYAFAKGTPDLEILRIANERMHSELNKAWSTRDPDLPLANPYEALILASIVEKETGLASERSLIAGVFIERLRKGMRLQTDPTVIYGIGDRYDGNIRKIDLQRDTPYNTYTRAGLPPTPICLPSAASLDAVMHPKITGAIYFVATGKGDGSSYFSKTLEEHNEALRKYLRTLRQR